jgi:hypothetical protein
MTRFRVFVLALGVASLLAVFIACGTTHAPPNTSCAIPLLTEITKDGGPDPCHCDFPGYDIGFPPNCPCDDQAFDTCMALVRAAERDAGDAGEGGP